jgi:hypothetical protein
MGEPLSPATVSVQRARALRRRMDERVRREGDRGMRVGRVSGLWIHSDREESEPQSPATVSVRR